jgi:formate dehydrogenase alpha subunit
MHIIINGKQCSFRSGMTIYEVARDHGIYIPVLCRHEDMRPSGACRICAVELTGCATLVASCSRPAENGMIIKADSEKVISFRRLIIQLLFAQGTHNCTECSSADHCVLQKLALEYDVEPGDYTSLHPSCATLDDANEMIVRDPAICIVCGLCVQACNELQVNEAIGITGRGPETKVGPPIGNDLADSECVFCGECLRVCPVGALSEKKSHVHQGIGTIKKTHTTCAYCGVGCQMDVHVQQNQIIKVSTPRMGAPSPNHGSLCIKGRFGYDFVSHPDRLTHALVRKGSRFVKVHPDDAVTLVADKLTRIKQEYGPDAIAGLSSARCTNEENYLFQKLFRSVIGTNNIDHCARLCHSSTVAGLAAVFGSAAMTNSIADIEKADCILVTGSNTTENHPVIGAAVKRAAQKGASLIVIDPRRIPLTRHATLWLQPRPGTDIAWINGLAHVMLQENLIDDDFIKERTGNVEAFKTAVADYTPQRVHRLTGIEPDDLIAAARMYGSAQRASILYAMGITQHVCGTDTVKALANLTLMTGNIGREGCGLNPLRGQNNVQGACDMGCLPGLLPGYQSVNDAEGRAVFEKAWDCRVPADAGMTAPEMLERALDGKLKALFIMGENPMMSEPDTAHVGAALDKLDLLVCQDIFLNETGRMADFVLPAAAWAEKNGTITNTERRVQRVRTALIPPGHARSDQELLVTLAKNMGASWCYDSAEQVFEEIRQLVPQYSGITYARIESVGLQWPCPHEDHPGTSILHTDSFPRGRALFSAVDATPPAEVPDTDYPFILSTGRILYHYHTATMSGRSRALLSRAPDAFVEVNPADAETLGLTPGHRVRVSSRRGTIELSALITSRCAAGIVFIPFHYSEAAANVLTTRALDPVAKIAEVKVCAVRIEKVESTSARA